MGTATGPVPRIESAGEPTNTAGYYRLHKSPLKYLPTAGDSGGCASGWSYLSGADLCIENAMHSGNMDTAISTCQGRQARVCKHVDLQAYCNSENDVFPFKSGYNNGWFGKWRAPH